MLGSLLSPAQAFKLGQVGFTAGIALAVVLVSFVTGAPAILSSPLSLTLIEDGINPLSSSNSKVLEPKAPGTTVFSSGGGTIDVSNANEGYVMVKHTGNRGIRVRITNAGKKTYTYHLNARNAFEVFPLTSGDGRYTITIFENVRGNDYAQGASGSVDVKLRNSLLPFLYPNQQVNFNKDMETVKKSNSLSSGAQDQLAIVSNVYNFVIENIKYDNNKANDVVRGVIKSNYVPVVDTILKDGKGICFDFAAVTAAMLRAQGIPTRLEKGYVSGGVYHAWISVYLKDVGWVNGVIQFDGKTWSLMDPTFASGAGARFVGDGKSYKTDFIF